MNDDLTLPPREIPADERPRDIWAPYAVAGIHPGPDHTHHAGHRDREEQS